MDETNENIKSIVATNLYDMLLEVQSGVKQGYVISDKNEYFPQAYVGLYTCGMVKCVAKEETSVANQETLSKASTEPSKRVSKRVSKRGTK